MIHGKRLTCSTPNLVWMPKIYGAKIMDPSTSINWEQEQSIDCSHLHSPPQSPSPSLENPKDNPPLAEFAIDDEMANFPVNPRPFLIGDLQVDHVWNRPARGRVALSGEATREH